MKSPICQFATYSDYKGTNLAVPKSTVQLPHILSPTRPPTAKFNPLEPVYPSRRQILIHEGFKKRMSISSRTLIKLEFPLPRYLLFARYRIIVTDKRSALSSISKNPMLEVDN